MNREQQAYRSSAYESYLQSPHWKSLSKRKLDAVGWACNRCNSTQNLEVHHVYYAKNWWLAQLADLEVLCHKCHKSRHHIRNPDKKFKKAKPRNVAFFSMLKHPAFDSRVCARY